MRIQKVLIFGPYVYQYYYILIISTKSLTISKSYNPIFGLRNIIQGFNWIFPGFGWIHFQPCLSCSLGI